jgi:hypothetical protein
MRSRLTLYLIIAAAMVSMVMATSAAAQTVTVGADLSKSIETIGGCGDFQSCGSIISSAESPATVTVAPFDGTVTAWRIEGATSEPGYGIEVLKKQSSGKYLVTAAATPVTPAGSGIETFKTELPIKAGEAIEVSEPESGTIALLEGNSVETFFQPSLLTGEGEAEEDFPQTFVIGFNVDITSPPEPAPVITPTAPVTPIATPTPTCTVPTLKGKKLKAAKKKLKAADCKLGKVTKAKGVTAKSGKVVSQGKKAGKVLAAGTQVSVKLG